MSKEDETCPGCGRHHGSNNFPLYRCPNCGKMSCGVCLTTGASVVCQTCRKVNPVKVR